MRIHYHPLAVLLYVGTVITIAVTTDHPLLLCLLMGTLALHSGIAGAWRRLVASLKVSIWMGVLFVCINALISHYGRTLLWKGPHLPVLGRVRITLEAVLYGADMGLRFLVVVLAVVLYSAWMEGDALFLLLRNVVSKSSITAALTARMIPHMTQQVQTVSDVMRVRGVAMRTGSVLTRVRGHYPLLKVMLVEALEGAWEIAEAMQARAYGRGKRTRYKSARWSRWDFGFLLNILAIWGVFLVMVVRSDTHFLFYPRLGRLFPNSWSIGFFGAFFVLLLLPGLVMYIRSLRWNPRGMEDSTLNKLEMERMK
jgi:energy-coupling factor transport system permease protein